MGPPEYVIARKIKMDLWPTGLVVRALRKVILPNCQNQVAKFVDAHRIPNFEIHIWSLVCEVGDEDVRFLNESHDLALQQSSLIVTIDATRFEATRTNGGKDGCSAQLLQFIASDLDNDESLRHKRCLSG